MIRYAKPIVSIVSLIYLELMFQLKVFHTWSFDFIYPFLFGISLICFLDFLGHLFKPKTNKIISFIFLFLIVLVFNLQTIYYDTFQVFTHLNSIFHGTGQILAFKNEIMNALLQNVDMIVFYSLPLIAYGMVAYKTKFSKNNLQQQLITLALSVGVYLIAFLCLLIPHHGMETTLDVYLDNKASKIVMQRFGVMTSMRLQIRELFFEYQESTSKRKVKPYQLQMIDRNQLNQMKINFNALNQKETNAKIKELHSYFANVQATNKNEYTGMFQDFNLIYITAEAFSDYVIDEQLTPTLYKMRTVGFYFKNFYNPLWGVSTSDGEYVNCIGLYPKEGVWSFSNSSTNSLPFTMGQQFQKLKVPTYSYHNHTYTYYDRDQSHPNIWNHYKGLGNGLDVAPTWPESDVEMIQKTSDEYMKNERFHAYFMSVSGHLDYTWNGNTMSSKHYDEVKDLPVQELSKGYLAAQIEFDRAMEQLLSDLKKYDQEDTLIVIAPDHYPYGLEEEHIEELSKRKINDEFDLYKSGVIIYSPLMEEAVDVNTVCSSIDILPTVSNLLGLEYDSRLLMGVDVFSGTETLVVLADGSFMNQEIKYDVKKGEALYLKYPMSDEKIKIYYERASKKLEISAKILESDYYRYLNLHE